MAKEFTFEVIETLAELDNGKMLRVVSWNKRKPSLDLRKWFEDEDGNEKPGKGISFSESEASDIVAALSDYLEKA